MVRKEIYISEAHDRALKKKAREAGVSEAELLRGILDDVLSEADKRESDSVRGRAIREFLDGADAIAEKHRFPEGYKFDREELYSDFRGYSGDKPSDR